MKKSNNDLMLLVNALCELKTENNWLEFKENLDDKDKIGQTVSALANSAALEGKDIAYLIWGIDDKNHEICGTKFDPSIAKKGNENLVAWLSKKITPNIFLNFEKCEINNKKIVILEIEKAINQPIRFDGESYIRIESNNKNMKFYPEYERRLWKVFEKVPFEKKIAKENQTISQVLKLIDYRKYFELLSRDIPTDNDKIIDELIRNNFIFKSDSGLFNITNLGAVLFAIKMTDFESLDRKVIRVIQYAGKDRTSNSVEKIGERGYAVGFEGLIDYINWIIPKNEILTEKLRKDIPMFPELAIRELVANSLIHQDFSINGTGPMIEIFDNRMEISNPGIPLIEIDRFIDHAPISKNEILAKTMRIIGVCEERGSGFDKVASLIELFQLPAPEIEISDTHTKVILFAHKLFREMTKNERMNAVYMHACLLRVNREYVTNATLRKRFNISQDNGSMISRLIKDTVSKGMIKFVDENASDKMKKYIPYWS